MTVMTIHDLEDDLMEKLRMSAQQHGRSMEDEVCSILRDALRAESLSGREAMDSIPATVEPGRDVQL